MEKMGHPQPSFHSSHNSAKAQRTLVQTQIPALSSYGFSESQASKPPTATRGSDLGQGAKYDASVAPSDMLLQLHFDSYLHMPTHDWFYFGWLGVRPISPRGEPGGNQTHVDPIWSTPYQKKPFVGCYRYLGMEESDERLVIGQLLSWATQNGKGVSNKAPVSRSMLRPKQDTHRKPMRQNSSNPSHSHCSSPLGARTPS